MEKLTFVERIEAIGKDSGKPYTRLNIKVQSKGDVKLSGFGNAQNAKWTEGQTVNIIITENGKYLNFTMAESKKGEELANNMKLDTIHSNILDTNAMLRDICSHLGIKHGYEAIQKAREAHNETQAVHRSGYTSIGANGEKPIKASDVDFVPDIDESSIPL